MSPVENGLATSTMEAESVLSVPGTGYPTGERLPVYGAGAVPNPVAPFVKTRGSSDDQLFKNSAHKI